MHTFLLHVTFYPVECADIAMISDIAMIVTKAEASHSLGRWPARPVVAWCYSRSGTTSSSPKTAHYPPLMDPQLPTCSDARPHAVPRSCRNHCRRRITEAVTARRIRPEICSG